MSLESTDITIDFVPELNPECKVVPLDTKYEGGRFLLTIGSRRHIVNRKVEHFLSLIDGSNSIADITQELNATPGNDFLVTNSDTIKLLKKVVIENGMLNSIEHSDKILKKSKPSSEELKKISLLGSKQIAYFSSFLKIAFLPQIVFCVMFLGFISRVIFYFAVMEPSYIDPDLIFSQFAIFLLISIISLFFHEFGHASALHYYKIKDFTIGVGIYLFMPVMYADVSRAWELKRGQRCVVNLGGVYFDLIISLILFVFAYYSDSMILLLAILFIDIKTIYNLIPFIKTDGYWVFSDATGIPNLQKNSHRLMIDFPQAIFKGRSFHFPSDMSLTSRVILSVYTFLKSVFYIYLVYILSEISFWMLIDIFNWMTPILTGSEKMLEKIRFSSLEFADIWMFFAKALILQFTITSIYKIVRATALQLRLRN
ncbi:MAG: hypothetical protein HRU19_26730 [Pseudobacteriovorax sp.]|nr:hypothetical protein [Pseudobacteriovorax sp.]